MVWQWHISWHCDNMNYVLKMVLPKCKECYVEVEIQVDCRHNFRNRQKCKIVMIKKEYLVKYWMKFNRYISGKK